jgi:hypothetical protein
MTTTNGRVPGMHSRQWRSVPRLVLGGAFMAMLLGIVYATGESAHVVASLAGFATAITVIVAAVISWERVVVTAESEGLIDRSHSALDPNI